MSSLYQFEIYLKITDPFVKVEEFVDFICLECDRYAFGIYKEDFHYFKGIVHRKKKSWIETLKKNIIDSPFKNVLIKRVNDFSRRFLHNYRIHKKHLVKAYYMSYYTGKDLFTTLLK